MLGPPSSGGLSSCLWPPSWGGPCLFSGTVRDRSKKIYTYILSYAAPDRNRIELRIYLLTQRPTVTAWLSVNSRLLGHLRTVIAEKFLALAN